VEDNSTAGGWCRWIEHSRLPASYITTMVTMSVVSSAVGILQETFKAPKLKVS